MTIDYYSRNQLNMNFYSFETFYFLFPGKLTVTCVEQKGFIKIHVLLETFYVLLESSTHQAYCTLPKTAGSSFYTKRHFREKNFWKGLLQLIIHV